MASAASPTPTSSSTNTESTTTTAATTTKTRHLRPRESCKKTVPFSETSSSVCSSSNTTATTASSTPASSISITMADEEDDELSGNTTASHYLGARRGQCATGKRKTDGVITVYNTPKRRRAGAADASTGDSCSVEGRPTAEDLQDVYCWECHKECVVEGALDCVSCSRTFHRSCISGSIAAECGLTPSDDWTCPVCLTIMKAECADTRSWAMQQLSVDQFSTILGFALQRMKHPDVKTSEAFHNPVPASLLPGYYDIIFHPMDLSSLDKNIKKKLYASTEAFLEDAKWILHNSVIYHGSTSKYTTDARLIIKICRHEMAEIELCPDCYLNSCIRTENWFTEPCTAPHCLVWAKLKGFPFWPAKALRVSSGNNVDVRFFGAHDRAWIPLGQVYLLSSECPLPVKNTKKFGLDKAVDELNVHIARLTEKFGEFNYAPFKTEFKPEHLYFCSALFGKNVQNSEIAQRLLATPAGRRYRDAITDVSIIVGMMISGDDQQAATADQMIRRRPPSSNTSNCGGAGGDNKSTKSLDDDDITTATATAGDHLEEDHDVGGGSTIEKRASSDPGDTSSSKGTTNSKKRIKKQQSNGRQRRSSNSWIHQELDSDGGVKMSSSAAAADEEEEEIQQEEPPPSSRPPDQSPIRLKLYLNCQTGAASTTKKITTSSSPSTAVTTSTSANSSGGGSALESGAGVNNDKALPPPPAATSSQSPDSTEPSPQKLLPPEAMDEEGTEEICGGGGGDGGGNREDEESGGTNDQLISTGQRTTTNVVEIEEVVQGGGGGFGKLVVSDAKRNQTKASPSSNTSKDEGSVSRKRNLQSVLEKMHSTILQQQSPSSASASVDHPITTCSPSSSSFVAVPTFVGSEPSSANNSFGVYQEQQQQSIGGPSRILSSIIGQQNECAGNIREKYVGKINDFVHSTITDMLREVRAGAGGSTVEGGTGSSPAQAQLGHLRSEFVKMQCFYNEAMRAMKATAKFTILEGHQLLEAEKAKALTEMTRRFEEEKRQAIAETKTKQWCANCGKEAVFYCCWNTSYCDYPCQQHHWPKHQASCAQMRPNQDASAQANNISSPSIVPASVHQYGGGGGRLTTSTNTTITNPQQQPIYASTLQQQLQHHQHHHHQNSGSAGLYHHHHRTTTSAGMPVNVVTTSAIGPGQVAAINSAISRQMTALPPATPTNTTNGDAGGYKSGHASFVELITQAIHSSPEQRMTLSEIYDWMVVNVQAFKDQHYFHHFSGWKNSVRHNLSLHSRFKRVKRNGMNKPSWWTVDLSEEVKRERERERNHHSGGGIIH